MKQHKTDNSFFNEKVFIRYKFLPEKDEINVLDLYAGKGKIWNKVKSMTLKKINIISIDKENKGNLFVGNNIKFIKNLNLDYFDIIDLDAYGIPFLQLEEIFKKGYRNILFLTVIFSYLRRMNNKLLMKLGYSKNMINKIPSLICKNGFEKFKNYLALNNIKNIKYIDKQNKKYYIYINLKNPE